MPSDVPSVHDNLTPLIPRWNEEVVGVGEESFDDGSVLSGGAPVFIPSQPSSPQIKAAQPPVELPGRADPVPTAAEATQPFQPIKSSPLVAKKSRKTLPALSEEDYNALVNIQKSVRGYLGRKRYKRIAQEKLMLRQGVLAATLGTKQGRE